MQAALTHLKHLGAAFQSLRGSDDPVTQLFHEWVDKEVLPLIAVSGGYVLNLSYAADPAIGNAFQMPFPPAAHQAMALQYAAEAGVADTAPIDQLDL